MLGSATDPEEGAALAVAISEHFLTLGPGVDHHASDVVEDLCGQARGCGECCGWISMRLRWLQRMSCGLAFLELHRVSTLHSGLDWMRASFVLRGQCNDTDRGHRTLSG